MKRHEILVYKKLPDNQEIMTLLVEQLQPFLSHMFKIKFIKMHPPKS